MNSPAKSMAVWDLRSMTLIGLDEQLPPGKRLLLDHVLFLDFDGVLHPEGCGPDMEFCFMPQFGQVMQHVDPSGEVPIVISSMWRFNEPLDKLREFFPDRLRHQIVGVTPEIHRPLESIGTAWDRDSTLHAKPAGWERGQRQREIEAWMQTYSPAGKWLALDDRAHWFDESCPQLFLLPDVYEHGGGGISNVQAVKLQRRLREFIQRAPQLLPAESPSSPRPR